MNEKSNYVRLQELKLVIKNLIYDWRSNGNEIMPRAGKIYKALADELERSMNEFERREQGLNYIEVD